jgi:cation diffusion facilitator family transporter
MPGNTAGPIPRGRTLALAGLAVNIALALAKLLAGILGHSYALIADAAESLTDIAGSAVIWAGLRYAARPPDERHPYGHGRAESIAALIGGILVLAAGVGIGVQAVRAMLAPQQPPRAFTLAVLIGVVVVKETMFRIVRSAAAAERSAAVQTDAWHHRADAITSLAAGVGISVTLIGGPAWAAADAWAALVGAVIILYNAVRLLHTPFMELMDTTPPEVADQARAIAGAVDGVRSVEKVLARKSGRFLLLDMHVWVDGAMTVVEAHDIAHRIKERVRGAMPGVADVLVHVEPARDADSSARPQ